jgi:hypothetical protein
MVTTRGSQMETPLEWLLSHPDPEAWHRPEERWGLQGPTGMGGIEAAFLAPQAEDLGARGSFLKP